MDKGGQSLLLFPVWHGKGQEVNKLKSYAVNQLKVTRNTFRDPIIAAVTVSMIAVLLIFVVWPAGSREAESCGYGRQLQFPGV